MNADPAHELAGAGVRRFTRRATAARADTSWLTLGGDVLSALTTAAVVVAVLGGAFASLRERIAARPETGSAVLPGELTALVAAVLVTSAVVALLSRLGPVSATPATAAWWLPLPAGRRGLLRGELRKVGLVAVVAAVVVALPVVLAAPRAPTRARGGGHRGRGCTARAGRRRRVGRAAGRRADRLGRAGDRDAGHRGGRRPRGGRDARWAAGTGCPRHRTCRCRCCSASPRCWPSAGCWPRTG